MGGGHWCFLCLSARTSLGKGGVGLMIELYTGTPGSGKSLHCASEIYFRVKRGKNCIANFDINMGVFRKKKKAGLFVYVDNSDLNPDLLMDLALSYHKRNTNGHIVEAQTTLIIDECQILFNSRDWQAADRMKWAVFFTQHRKYGYNIILITQFDRLIDRQIRSVVEYEVVHRKASNFQFFGMLLGLFFKGNVFVAVTRWYGVKERMGSEFFVLMPRYAHMYDSYKIFGAQPEPGFQGDPAKPAPTRVNYPVILKRIIKIGTTPISFKRPPKDKEHSFSKNASDKSYGSIDEFWNKSKYT